MISPLKRQSLSETVAHQLAELILTGELEPGRKLDSEHSLAKQFGVSRNVVREGLRRLTSQGLVAVRAGDGIYVQVPDSSTVVGAFSRYMRLNRTDKWVDELYQVRRLLESEIAALAAELATAEDIQALEQALEEMRAHTDDPTDWAQSDWAFHEALALATHNSLFPIILMPLHSQALRAFEEGWHYPKAYESGLHYHGEILECVRRHDSEAARRAMLTHLEVSFQEVQAALQFHARPENAVVRSG